MGMVDIQGIRGGDVIFQPGDGQDVTGVKLQEFDGSIRFELADRTEVMRFKPDGRVYVRGELVDDNMTIYKVFKTWLETAMIVR